MHYVSEYARSYYTSLSPSIPFSAPLRDHFHQAHLCVALVQGTPKHTSNLSSAQRILSDAHPLRSASQPLPFTRHISLDIQLISIHIRFPKSHSSSQKTGSHFSHRRAGLVPTPTFFPLQWKNVLVKLPLSLHISFSPILSPSNPLFDFLVFPIPKGNTLHSPPLA